MSLSAAWQVNAAVGAGNVQSTILVIAKDAASVSIATSGLNGYGIPFSSLIVPQTGVELPELNSSSGGNFGGIVVANEVSYDYGNDIGYRSALTDDQWNQLYAYQLEYGVRMVHYGVYPGPKYGTTALGTCCDDDEEQEVSFTDISDFPTSGIKTGAGVSTQNIMHFPASISNTSTTKEIAQFAPNSRFNEPSTAAVINNFDGRQQMAWFMGFDTSWSPTSSFLQHAWITWITHGLYAGYRRVNLNTQVDDMFLETKLYHPNDSAFRARPEDMSAIKDWVSDINKKLNSGSEYFVEVGHNGNGNIEYSAKIDENACNGGEIKADDVAATPLEFKKPLGTGTDVWPETPTTYNWSSACTDLDPLKKWWSTPENRDAFGIVSHTFTHLSENNATYDDVYKEISFNIAWLKHTGQDQGARFTANGLIPPAITGLHNGDALRAWVDNGITNCVGDNTRPSLINKENVMHPYVTTMEADGYAGMQVNPRWSTRIYFNCDTPECTTKQWIDTSAGSGDFHNLLAAEKSDTMRRLFGLNRAGYMFHQANLRVADAEPITINGVTTKLSIFQAWVETIVQEFVRLVDWPVITLKHADVGSMFPSQEPNANWKEDVGAVCC